MTAGTDETTGAVAAVWIPLMKKMPAVCTFLPFLMPPWDIPYPHPCPPPSNGVGAGTGSGCDMKLRCLFQESIYTKNGARRCRECLFFSTSPPQSIDAIWPKSSPLSSPFRWASVSVEFTILRPLT